MPDDPEPQRQPILTDRRRQIVQLLADGRTLQEIADELFVARDTVKTLVKQSAYALGVSSRQGAIVAAAIRAGEIH